MCTVNNPIDLQKVDTTENFLRDLLKGSHVIGDKNQLLETISVFLLSVHKTEICVFLKEKNVTLCVL